MNDMIKKFHTTLRWSAFESIFYKAILVGHQICLFFFAPRFVYGFSSLIFAIIYLTVELINLGFDRTCAQLSATYFDSKDHFRAYFIPQVIIQGAILATLFLLICFQYQFLNHRLLPESAFLTQKQWSLLGLIIVCESLRKTLRLFSQLLFLNKPAAILEASLIIIYVFLFWIAIFMGCSIEISTIYVPLLIQSIIGIIILFYFIVPKLKLELQIKSANIDSYNLLPQKYWPQIVSSRLQNYLYQLSEIFFSSNFLIYFLSSVTSLLTIGPIKLANHLAVFVKSLLDRTFGLTTLAIFIRNKHLINSQKTFFIATQRALNLALFVILLICGLAISLVSNDHYLALLFFGFTLINNLLIVYEQLFLIYNKILTLFLLNFTVILIFLSFIYFAPHLSVANLIILFIFLRTIMLLIVRLIINNFFKKNLELQNQA